MSADALTLRKLDPSQEVFRPNRPRPQWENAQHRRAREQALDVPESALSIFHGKVLLGHVIYWPPRHLTRAYRQSLLHRRVREIEALIRSRHGWIDNRRNDQMSQETARKFLYIAFNTIVMRERHEAKRKGIERHICKVLRNWASLWLPRIPRSDLCTAIERTTTSPRRYKADTIALHLGVCRVEREKLGLQTIGAIDFPKAEREQLSKKRKKVRDREYAANKRKERGSATRKAYILNSVAEICRQLSISRTTYYRWAKEGCLEEKIAERHDQCVTR